MRLPSHHIRIAHDDPHVSHSEVRCGGSGLSYVIAYAVTGDRDHGTVTILHVIHTSRDWQPESWPH